MFEYIIVFIFIILWLYLTLCLFLMVAGGGFYIKNMPMIDNNGSYQVYNFIPLALFTNYFDKKVYIKN